MITLAVSMSLTSEAPFSPSVKNQIREIFDYRCVICLNSVLTSQCAHILDAATAGQQQVLNASELGILLGDYDRNAAPNGMIQCPTCHSYFTANTIVLSLPIPLLKYLQRYVTYTSKANRKSLHEVFSLLMDASLGTAVDLPDVNPVLPYIGLFTVVTLNPALVTGYWLVTPYLPSMSTIRGSNFVEAPSSTLPTAENAARIFHSNAINNDTPLRYGKIPLSPQNENFAEMRYWRLPVSAAPIFAALIARLGNDSSKCEDIRLAKNIQSILVLQQNNAYPLDVAGPSGSGPGGGGGGGGDDGPGGGGGGSGGGPGGGGPGGGGGSKRKETTRSPSSRKSNKRGRKASGGGGETHDCGNESARSQTGQPHHREITASSRSMEAPVELIDAGWNDTDSEGGRSVSSVNPHGKDDPAKWMFSPSFSTNKNVLIARAVNLTL